MVWHRAGAENHFSALFLSQIFAKCPIDRKGPTIPQGRAAQHFCLNAPFPWAGVHSAVQDILTNHGEFSSKALGIFIRLGNDAFTHAVFGKSSLLSSCLGLESWRESSSRAQTEAEPAAFIGKPRGSHREAKKQAA